MTNKELKDLISLMDNMRLKLKGDREASRKFLVDAGIFTKNGNLKKPYRELQRRAHSK